MIIAITGPSRAGKTTLLKLIVLSPRRYGLATSPPLLDLDESLGSSQRSDSKKAIGLIKCAAAELGDLIADVGAGQLVQQEFRSFLTSDPAIAIVVVWCDELAFRLRHGTATAQREFENNYCPALVDIWEAARRQARIIDTSTASEETSAGCLGEIIGTLVSRWSAG